MGMGQSPHGASQRMPAMSELGRPKSIGKDRSQRSGSPQPMQKEACMPCEMEGGLRSSSNFSNVIGQYGKPTGETLYAASVSHNMVPQSYRSQVSVMSETTAMQAAEVKALEEERKAKQRLHEKETKLEQFRAKTAQTAKQRLKQQKQEQMQESERKKA